MPGNKIKCGSATYTLDSNPLTYNGAVPVIHVVETIQFEAGDLIYSADAGKPDAQTFMAPAVHATLVFGADAYGVIDVDGSGTMETIIKPHGSSGSLDPLNQRATVGAKVAAYAAKVLNPLWLVTIEHCVSA